MSKIITTIVGLLFLLGAAMHGYRLYRRFSFIIGGYDIPVWWGLPVCGELLILGEISNSPHTGTGGEVREGKGPSV